MSVEIEILYEDNHLLAINKPAMLATMGALAGQPTAAAWAADYLKHRYAKPGNVFVGVVSRLDSQVSGVLVLARTSKAASRLSEQFRLRSPQKLYWACVEGVLNPKLQDNATVWQTLETHLRKDDTAHRMVTAKPNLVGSQLATLRYQLVAQSAQLSLLQVELETGRKHQIRLQMAELGHPILGDRKYDARMKFNLGIALHCHQLTIEHPTHHEPLTLAAQVPASWKRLPNELLKCIS